MIDPLRRLCRGCLRTGDEIAAWLTMPAAEKRVVLALVEQRRRAADPRPHA